MHIHIRKSLTPSLTRFLSVSLSICLSVCLTVCLSASLSLSLSAPPTPLDSALCLFFCSPDFIYIFHTATHCNTLQHTATYTHMSPDFIYIFLSASPTSLMDGKEYQKYVSLPEK